MARISTHRSIVLELLEDRLTPTGLLGLTLPHLPALPGPLAGLTNPDRLSLPVSLALPSSGHSGLSLGVDLGILSLNVGVGSGSLLSLGVGLDLPVLPSLSLQTAIGSGNSLLSLGLNLDPPASQGTGPDQGGLTPPPKVDPPVVTPPVNLPPLGGTPPAHTPPSIGTPLSLTSLLPTSLAPSQLNTIIPVQTISPNDGGEFVSSVENIELQPARSLAPVDQLFAGKHAASADSDGEAFLSWSKSPADSAVRSTPDGDEVTDELFRLRDGALLEDFGTAIPENQSTQEDTTTEAEQSAGDRALALWLVGILAGCVAGSAWLNRRKAEAEVSLDVDPFLVPVR